MVDPSRISLLASSLVRLYLSGHNRTDVTPDGTGGFAAPSDTRYFGALWSFRPFGIIQLLTEQRSLDGKTVTLVRAANGRSGSANLNSAISGNSVIPSVPTHRPATQSPASTAHFFIQSRAPATPASANPSNSSLRAA